MKTGWRDSVEKLYNNVANGKNFMTEDELIDFLRLVSVLPYHCMSH